MCSSVNQQFSYTLVAPLGYTFPFQNHPFIVIAPQSRMKQRSTNVMIYGLTKQRFINTSIVAFNLIFSVKSRTPISRIEHNQAPHNMSDNIADY
jgi:hypothetical protein